MPNHQIFPDNIDKVTDLKYELLDRKYPKIQLLNVVLRYLILMLLSLFILFTERVDLLIMAECVLAAACIVNLAVVPKAYAVKGYAFREHDISYRRGLLYRKVTTIPYSKVQQVSVEQDPVARLFGLYSVEVVNGAQEHSQLDIPGLTEERANQIKTFILERIKDGKH